MYVEIRPEAESAESTSILNKFQNIMIMLAGCQDKMMFPSSMYFALVFSCRQASTTVISCRATFVILNRLSDSMCAKTLSFTSLCDVCCTEWSSQIWLNQVAGHLVGSLHTG